MSSLLLTAALLGAWVATMLHFATPSGDVLAYAAYAAFAVVVPGTIVHKALRGAQDSWASDLALGAATGLCLELFAWAGATAVGLPALLRWWPLVAVGLCLAGRGPRRRVLTRPTGWWPWPVSLSVAAAIALVCWHLARTYLAVYDLPPTGRPYYPDLLYHLGLAAEATRSVPLGTPQAVGQGTLHYHWFADAHLAAVHDITGVALPTLLLRLWVLPVAALTVLVTAALAKRVTGSSTAAAVSAWVVAPGMTLDWWPWAAARIDAFSPLSPSQLYSMPLTVLLVHALADVLGGRRRRGAATVLAVSALACAGAKASALPVLLGGVLLALAVAVLRRGSGRIALGATAAWLLAVEAVARGTVQGSFGGSGFQLFSDLSSMTAYRELVQRLPDLHTPVLPGLLGHGPERLWLFLGLLGVELVRSLRTVLLVLPLLLRRLRADLMAWVLAGACAAGLAALLGISHPGYSEYYFVEGTTPFGAVLGAWGLVEVTRGRSRRARVTAVSAVAAGAAVSAVGLLVLPPRTAPSGQAQVVAALWRPLWVLVGLAAVPCLVWLATRLRRRSGPTLAAPMALGLVTGLLVAALPAQLPGEPGPGPARLAAATHEAGQVTRDQTRAALWISHHVPQGDVMATNDHCVGAHGPFCAAKAWWVSGLGQRRTLVDGWAYVGALGAPFPDQRLLALNDRTFTHPSSALLAALRDKGVGWLVASTAAGPVSPRLAELATQVYAGGVVSIYHLAR
ncbi:hypothetical protein [Oryzihumus leptocrescens]|uniref:Uncharacterized protein n=1 Tax=Oryzihumus leptocrescens TaxID=297536 RepID=A0A542ZG98_9MICO|nr:hypothetical protein [Oryzihumus leptocrescens]TQL59366.1 hypothetical protein FB474_0720 [Oryzihumus leptocrescens]